MIQKGKVRMQILFALGPFATLALFLFMILGGSNHPDLDFLNGFLSGISIVGNMAFIFVATRYLYRLRRQK